MLSKHRKKIYFNVCFICNKKIDLLLCDITNVLKHKSSINSCGLDRDLIILIYSNNV